jgi:hypothetical protein
LESSSPHWKHEFSEKFKHSRLILAAVFAIISTISYIFVLERPHFLILRNFNEWNDCANKGFKWVEPVI